MTSWKKRCLQLDPGALAGFTKRKARHSRNSKQRQGSEKGTLAKVSHLAGLDQDFPDIYMHQNHLASFHQGTLPPEFVMQQVCGGGPRTCISNEFLKDAEAADTRSTLTLQDWRDGSIRKPKQDEAKHNGSGLKKYQIMESHGYQPKSTSLFAANHKGDYLMCWRRTIQDEALKRLSDG